MGDVLDNHKVQLVFPDPRVRVCDCLCLVLGSDARYHGVTVFQEEVEDVRGDEARAAWIGRSVVVVLTFLGVVWWGYL